MILKSRVFDLGSLETRAARVLKRIEESVSIGEKVWIAGGFPRRIAHYLMLDAPAETEDYFRNGGDVDIFVSPGIPLEDLWKGPNQILEKSMAGFAKETMLGGFKIQIVTHEKLRYETVEECLNSFDIHNSMYAITKENNQWKIYWSLEAVEADKKKEVKIHRVDSPLLGSRIIKYIWQRGCSSGVSEDSKKILPSWFLNVLCENWNEVSLPISKTSFQPASIISKMIKEGLVRKEDVALFLGKWRMKKRLKVDADDDDDDIFNYSGFAVEVDWAEVMAEKIGAQAE